MLVCQAYAASVGHPSGICVQYRYLSDVTLHGLFLITLINLGTVQRRELAKVVQLQRVVQQDRYAQLEHRATGQRTRLPTHQLGPRQPKDRVQPYQMPSEVHPIIFNLWLPVY